MMTRADLKPGDWAIVTHNGGLRKALVVRATKTQLMLEDGSRWLIRTGRRVNAPAWDRSQIDPFDAAAWAEYVAASEVLVARSRLVQRFAALCNRLTAEQIARINAVLDEVSK